jgi:hypothetical protein
MVEQSPAATEALSFIEWLRAERYTDYTIDCHIRRLLFVMPRLAPGSSPPILRDRALVAAFGRERRPYSRFTNFAATRRAYTRYLSAQGRLVQEPDAPNEDVVRRYDQYLIDVRGLSDSARCHHELTVRALFGSIQSRRRSLQGLSRDDVEQLISERSQRVSRHTLQHEVAQLRAFLLCTRCRSGA